MSGLSFMGIGARSGLLGVIISSIITLLAAPPAQAQSTTTYTYDALGRLTATSVSNGSQTSYTYDPAGNRTLVSSFTSAPTAGNVALSTTYNTVGQATLAPGGDYTSLAIATNPSHGTASISGTTATYTPTTGYVGADSFTYTATGPGGTSAPGTVSVTVVAPNAPTAGNVALSTSYNTVGHATLAPGGNYTSLAIATNPSHGTASISGTTATYTPTTGYSGSDSFTYTATGPGGTSAPGTVSVTVSAAAPPTVGNVPLSAPFNGPGTAGLTPSGIYTSLAIATTPAHGTASISGTTVTYTPTTDFYGSDSFTYTATGPGGTSAPGTVSVTVATPQYPAGTVFKPTDSGSGWTFTVPVSTLHHVIVACSGADGGASSQANGGQGGTATKEVAVTPGSTVFSGSLGLAGGSGSLQGTNGGNSTCSSTSSSPSITLTGNGGQGAIKTRAGSGGTATGGSTNATGATGGSAGVGGKVTITVSAS